MCIRSVSASNLAASTEDDLILSTVLYRGTVDGTVCTFVLVNFQTYVLTVRGVLKLFPFKSLFKLGFSWEY
jgi:hypothetical protein